MQSVVDFPAGVARSASGCPVDGWGAMNSIESKSRTEDEALFLAQTEVRHLKESIRALRDELERMRIDKETGIRQAVAAAGSEAAQLKATITALRDELEMKRIEKEENVQAAKIGRASCRERVCQYV